MKKQFPTTQTKHLLQINVGDWVKFRSKSSIPATLENREYLFKTLAQVTEVKTLFISIKYPNGQELKKVKKGDVGLWREQLTIGI